MTSRRFPILAGLLFVLVSVAYAAFAPVLGYHIEWAGVTMLFALGAAMALMSYVLIAGVGKD